MSTQSQREELYNELLVQLGSGAEDEATFLVIVSESPQSLFQIGRSLRDTMACPPVGRWFQWETDGFPAVPSSVQREEVDVAEFVGVTESAIEKLGIIYTLTPEGVAKLLAAKTALLRKKGFII